VDLELSPRRNHVQAAEAGVPSSESAAFGIPAGWPPRVPIRFRGEDEPFVVMPGDFLRAIRLGHPQDFGESGLCLRRFHAERKVT
jgi:hypothetical protein